MGTSYRMDHSTFTFLIGTDGRYPAHFPTDMPPDQMNARTTNFFAVAVSDALNRTEHGQINVATLTDSSSATSEQKPVIVISCILIFQGLFCMSLYTPSMPDSANHVSTSSTTVKLSLRLFLFFMAFLNQYTDHALSNMGKNASLFWPLLLQAWTISFQFFLGTSIFLYLAIA